MIIVSIVCAGVYQPFLEHWFRTREQFAKWLACFSQIQINAIDVQQKELADKRPMTGITTAHWRQKPCPTWHRNGKKKHVFRSLERDAPVHSSPSCLGSASISSIHGISDSSLLHRLEFQIQISKSVNRIGWSRFTTEYREYRLIFSGHTKRMFMDV